MANMSQYLDLKVLDHCMGKTSFTMPATVALALTTVAVTPTMTGATITEATYTGYARVAIPAASLTAASYSSGGTTSNSAAINFAACTAGSSTVIGFAILDSTTIGAGNLLYFGTVTSQVVSSGITPSVPIGSLVVTQA